MRFLRSLRRLLPAGAFADSGSLSAPAVRIVHEPALPAVPVFTPDELARAIDRVGERLEKQHVVTAGALAQLDGLPNLVSALGDVRRQSLTLTEMLGEHAERSRRGAESLQVLLQRTCDAVSGQSEAVIGVEQQIDSVVRTVGGLGEDVERLRAALVGIAEQGASASRSLAEIADSQRQREIELVSQLHVWRRWTVLLLALTAIAGLVAATASIIGLTR